MEQNNQRNSKKRLNSLILLVAFTAVMLIVSTYAWFSTQKNVTFSGIYGKVNVAEGLQISLDAKTWKNEINFSDFTTGTKEVTYTNADNETVTETITGLVSSTYTPDGTLQNPTGDGTITNVIPGELLPASTIGTESINAADYVYMYRGTNENGNTLTDIKLVDETSSDEVGYFAIDLYLQNSSATGVTSDVLQLEGYSTITINTDKASTGLQNTVRVGLAQYNDLGVAVDGVKGQADILTEAEQKYVKDVAIWEPNADAHSDYVKNNQRIIYSYTGNADDGYTPVYTTYGGTTDWKDVHTTYALNATAVTNGSVAEIYNWSTGSNKEAGFSEQVTLQTTAAQNSSTEEDPIPLISATDNTKATNITIPASQYVKCRLYIWLEGQDVDCINQASLGGGLTVDFGFSKPGSKSSGSGESTGE